MSTCWQKNHRTSSTWSRICSMDPVSPVYRDHYDPGRFREFLSFLWHGWDKLYHNKIELKECDGGGIQTYRFYNCYVALWSSKYYRPAHVLSNNDTLMFYDHVWEVIVVRAGRTVYERLINMSCGPVNGVHKVLSTSLLPLPPPPHNSLHALLNLIDQVGHYNTRYTHQYPNMVGVSCH